MHRSDTYILSLAILAILVGSLVLQSTATGQPGPSPKDVNVVNTPLPTTVQGANVTAAVTGDVNVSNTPLPVKLAPTANVNVVNDESNPVPVVLQNGPTSAPELVG